MNIFKWITGRAGKVALSAMQAVGLTAVVGVAGIAAWQYLDAPAETNNTFTPAAYDAGEVVYVAGANTGSYAGGSYAGGGESQSSVRISSNTLKRLEQQEISQRAAKEMAEYAPDYTAPVSTGQAYQMGTTEGLGTGANAANELDLKNNPMAAMQQSLAGITNMVSQAQVQAQQARSAAAATPEGGATLASASKNWGSSRATGGSSGNAFNSSFAVQDSGKSKSSSGADAAKQAGDVLASAQAQAANMMQEGSRIRGRASFGKSSGLGDSRDATAGSGTRVNSLKNELEDMVHMSSKIAAKKNRQVTEAGKVFLASSQLSGGMMITSDHVTTGQGQGSKDFEKSTQSQLRGIGAWGANVDLKGNLRDKDRHDMQTWLWVAIGVATVAAISIPLVKKIPIWGWVIALGLALTATAFCALGFAKAASFAKNWGKTGYSTAAMVVTGLLTAGVWLSFVLSGGFMKEALDQIAIKLGLGGAKLSVGAIGAGVGAAGALSVGGGALAGKTSRAPDVKES